MAPLTSRQCYDLLPSQYYEKNPVVDLKAWFKWANQKLCWCPVWERCIGAFVSLFLSWNHPLYLNWEEYVTVTAVCNHFCLHSASTFNTGITCDITFLLQSASKTPRQALPKFTERMGAFLGELENPALPGKITPLRLRHKKNLQHKSILLFERAVWRVFKKTFTCSWHPDRNRKQSWNNTQLQKIKTASGGKAVLLWNLSSGTSSKSILDAFPLPAAYTRQDAERQGSFVLISHFKPVTTTSSAGLETCILSFTHTAHFWICILSLLSVFSIMPWLLFRHKRVCYFSWTITLLTVYIRVWVMTS